MTENKLTTGEAFGRLYNELVDCGVPEDVAGSIVREAAITAISEFGYVIKGAEA